MARFRTPESASPGKSPGGSCGCRAHRAGKAADGTQRERAYSPDPNRRHWSMDAVAREAVGNADRSRRAPTHPGRRRGPKTLVDQVPEDFPVDRQPGHGEAWLITPGSVPRSPTRLFRTGLPRGERVARAAARPSPVPHGRWFPAEPSALAHIAAISPTIRRWSTASTSTVTASCRCATTAPAPRASSANADTAPRTRSGHSRHGRSAQGLDEFLPVEHPALRHRFRLGASDRDSFRPRAKLPRPHPGSRLPLLRQSRPPTASADSLPPGRN
ncbi:hypothetical protein SUDANB126_07314 [Streptomyces sp. enrichment culture]